MVGADVVAQIMRAAAGGDAALATRLVDDAPGLTEEERSPLRAAVAEVNAARAASAEDLRVALGELAELRPRAAHLEAEVERLEAEVTVHRNDLLDAWSHLRSMRNTASWRLTWPFRAMARLGRRT